MSAINISDQFSQVIRNDSIFHDMVKFIRIQPHFQPIVDLYTAMVLGYEVLSRGEPPFEVPLKMFSQAKALSMTWELENSCRTAAFEKIAAMSDLYSGRKFFLNVSPEVFGDARFADSFIDAAMQTGLSADHFVIEITENASLSDYPKSGELLGHLIRYGFLVALDDFGSGYSSLSTLIAVSPNYIKLDKAIVRDVHKDAYKQHVIKAVASISAGAENHLIAEGVETWDELDTLLRLGVRYAQGFLLARPKPDPESLTETIRAQTQQYVKKYNSPKNELDETISSLVMPAWTVRKNKVLCEKIDEHFKRQQLLDHLVILDESDSPCGLVTRPQFYMVTSGPYGYHLVQKKTVDHLAKKNPLVVEDQIRVSFLAKQALDRLRDDQYDPVLVTDSKGKFIGSITIRQLIARATEMELNAAKSANPLTGLPGNRVIYQWLLDVFHCKEFSVIYADLGNFKEYNDTYGFLMGDELIRLTAKVLAKGAAGMTGDVRLGHVGGDDFVIIANRIVTDNHLSAICESFDREKLEFFEAGHVQDKGYMATNRSGQLVKIPLVTLSLSVINSDSLLSEPHPAFLAQMATSLKKVVKKMSAESGLSTFMIERRKNLTG